MLDPTISENNNKCTTLKIRMDIEKNKQSNMISQRNISDKDMSNNYCNSSRDEIVYLTFWAVVFTFMIIVE